jgi:hypothetical protein
MSEKTILDLDAMLDTEMSKVESIPDFVTPPAGDYVLKVTEAKVEKFERKAKDNKPAESGSRIKIFYSVEKTIETKELPVKEGSLFSDSFMGTEEGIKFFKRQAMNILNVSDLDGAKLKDVLEGLKDQTFTAKISIRKTDDGKGGSYENVQVRPVHLPA